MRPYRSSRSILADVERVLAENCPAFNHSPLEQVAELLSEGRHYSWVGIYLTVHKNSVPALLENAIHPAQFAVPGAHKKIILAMKIAGREIGFLNVESDRDNAFGSEERVLLERVAGMLAKFLVGPGKYLVRKASQPAPTPKAAAA